MREGQSSADRIQFGARLLERHALRKTADGSHVSGGPVAPEARIESGDPDVRVPQAEPGRQHADDGVIDAVERDRAAEDCRISREEPPPAGIAHHRGGCGTGPYVFSQERAADARTDAED